MSNTSVSKEKNKIGKIVSYVISILCLVLCIFITIEVINANNDGRPPRIFGISVSHVPTASMEPTIKAGEYVMYSQASFDDVDVGNIVIYKSSNGMYIIHRVIEKHDNYLIAKGDNNSLADTEEITPNMVYGKYVMTIGFLSIFSGGISKNLIFFILIFIFIAMIGMQILSIMIKAKTEKVNKDAEEQKKLMMEQLRMQILEEELAKLREQNKADNQE